MTHLATRYIKYIVAKTIADRDSLTLEAVNFFLEKLGLPAFPEKGHGPSMLQAISSSVHPPTAYQFYNDGHKPTADWMRTEKIFSMWQPDDVMREVQTIFRYPAIKETLQLLLTGRVPPSDIANRIPRKYEKGFSAAAIQLFAHYFWDISLIDAQELEMLVGNSPMRPHYIACWWGSRDQALWRAGFSPAIDGHRALREAHRAMHMRIEATRSMPDSAETARIVASLSKELVVLHNALFGEGAGVEEMAKDLSKKFRMKQHSGNVIPISSLARAGNYTGSGLKNED